MPTYEFICPRCQATVALQYSIHATPPAPQCPMPVCGARMQRNYTAPGVSFKGDGWGKDK